MIVLRLEIELMCSSALKYKYTAICLNKNFNGCQYKKYNKTKIIKKQLSKFLIFVSHKR